ncbi:MAG: transposase-like zinc-binding domain-containing protein [Candidatus Kapaibacteriota bacterium]
MMITESYCCHACQSTNIVRNGHTASGKQRYHCKDCGVTRVLVPKPKLTAEAVACLERSNSERMSYRAMGRIFTVSHVTVFNHLKKKAIELPPLKTTILPAKVDDIMEVDEIFTFIAVKVFQIRI